MALTWEKIFAGLEVDKLPPAVRGGLKVRPRPAGWLCQPLFELALSLELRLTPFSTSPPALQDLLLDQSQGKSEMSKANLVLGEVSRGEINKDVTQPFFTSPSGSMSTTPPSTPTLG